MTSYVSVLETLSRDPLDDEWVLTLHGTCVPEMAASTIQMAYGASEVYGGAWRDGDVWRGSRLQPGLVFVSISDLIYSGTVLDDREAGYPHVIGQ
jgi:hypothetical protein